MNTLTNNCSNPKTLYLYNHLEKNPHINTIQMLVDNTRNSDKESAEIIYAMFDHSGMSFAVEIDVTTEVVAVFLDLYEDSLEEYGTTTFDMLLSFLNSLPHISTIMMKDFT